MISSLPLWDVIYRPGKSFSRTWEPTLWNAIKKECTPTSQPLLEGRSLTPISASQQTLVSSPHWPTSPNIFHYFSTSSAQHLVSHLLFQWSFQALSPTIIVLHPAWYIGILKENCTRQATGPANMSRTGFCSGEIKIQICRRTTSRPISRHLLDNFTFDNKSPKIL